VITDNRTRWRATFERAYGAGRFEEFCKYVVVDQTRPGIIRERFHSIKSGKPMTAPTYGIWAERAHRLLDGLV
jgi:hypothetical protein